MDYSRIERVDQVRSGTQVHRTGACAACAYCCRLPCDLFGLWMCVQTVAPTPSDFHLEFAGEGLTPEWDVGVARVRLDPILRPDEMAIVMGMMKEGRLGELERHSDDDEPAAAADGEGAADDGEVDE